MGKVYLTGAGPGDIELLTIKALKVIKKADVIMYDRLANVDILKEAKSGCEFIYVGKQDGKHTLSQEEINKLLLKYAKRVKSVVRLKGGDPFVFGRGSEEAIFLKKHNIEFEIIPGVTSAISVPAYAGIPVTHRGISVSFRVVTGHEDPNKSSSQIVWENFKSDDTIIFLMGFHRLHDIAQKLISIGKPKDYPCAVISKGTTKDQKVVVATLDNIAQKAKDLQTPALIVVGKVVELKEQLAWFKNSTKDLALSNST